MSAVATAVLEQVNPCLPEALSSLEVPTMTGGLNTGICAIIQCRLGSSRLPNKALYDIEGKPMIERVIERVKMSRLTSSIILATTTRPEDRLLCSIASRQGIGWFTGSENNVLDRFYQCIKDRPSINTVVRITGDCPLVDPQIIDGVIHYFLIGEFDMVTNRPGYPDGLDVEVFSRSALERTWKLASSPYDLEHVTSYMVSHPHLFKLGHFAHDVDLSDLKWSVDTHEDLDFVRQVYRKLGDEFTLQDILSVYEIPGILGGAQ